MLYTNFLLSLPSAHIHIVRSIYIVKFRVYISIWFLSTSFSMPTQVFNERQSKTAMPFHVTGALRVYNTAAGCYGHNHHQTDAWAFLFLPKWKWRTYTSTRFNVAPSSCIYIAGDAPWKSWCCKNWNWHKQIFNGTVLGATVPNQHPYKTLAHRLPILALWC